MRLAEFLHETRDEDINDISLMEQRLIEDRNILNTEDINMWASSEAADVALRLSSEKTLQGVLHTWLWKALNKYILTTVDGAKVEVDPHGNVYARGGLNAIVDKLPPWAQQAIEAGKELLYINPGMRTFGQDVPKDLRLVRDWLKHKIQDAPEQLTPNRLSRLSFQNALSLSDDYHEELIRKRPATSEEVSEWYLTYLQGKKDWTQRPWHVIQQDEEALDQVYRLFTKDTGRKVAGTIDTPEDHVLVKDYGDGNKWVKLTTGECLNYEGAQMGHCVADYAHDVESGYVDIISLRDKNNKPHVTIERAKESGVVSQMKGKENKAPVQKYMPYVIDMLTDIYNERGGIEFADEGYNDLSEMGLSHSKDGTLKMITPPFEPDSFGYKSVEYSGGDWGDEPGMMPESEQTHAEGVASLPEAMDAVAPDYHEEAMAADREYVVRAIVDKGVWEGDPSEDEFEPSAIINTIWYDGADKDVKREYKTVVPKS